MRLLRYGAGAVVAGILAGSALAGTPVVVPATSNMWGAGHAVAPDPGGGGGGTLPAEVLLPAGTGRTASFPSPGGSVDYGGCCDPNGPDGVDSACGEAPSWDGIAGLITGRGRFLAGVFLTEMEPADPAPDRLDLTGALNFASLSPAIAQTFFIGDGLTGEGLGDVQVFNVPDDATRLFLGFLDSCGCLLPPGWYSDNTGQLGVTVDVQVSCPWDCDGNDDGIVSVSDLLAMLGQYDVSAPDNCTGGSCDYDSNGCVDVADLLKLLAHYDPAGAGCP